MEILFYDIFLLITQNGGKNFDIVGFQIVITFNIGMEAFINKKKAKIIEAKFKAKSQKMLETSISRDFHSCCIIIKDKSIMVIQKKQVKKLLFVDFKNNIKKK